MASSIDQYRGEGVFLNLFSDHGFKTVFGNEENKPYLINLLNSILVGEEDIIDLTFLPVEKLGVKKESRKAIYDMYCETKAGEKIIVELQQSVHKNFRNRLVYYSTWPLQSQGIVGNEWSFKLKTVYTIGILDFIENDDDDLIHKAQIVDVKKGEVWSKALCYITLEAPKIPHLVEDCTTEVELWAWMFKNSYKLKSNKLKVPKLFKSFLEKCRLNNIPQFDENNYRKSLMDLQELKLVKEYAFEQGIEQGIEQGVEKERLAFRAKLEAKGFSEEEIKEILE